MKKTTMLKTLALCLALVVAVVGFAAVNAAAATHCPEGTYVNGICNACGAYQPADYVYPEDGEEYYAIGNAGQLYWFAQQVNNGEEYINGKLTADIVVNENVLAADGSLNAGSYRSWVPISNGNRWEDTYWDDEYEEWVTEYYYVNYDGHFDGQGHTVSGLYYQGSEYSYMGLFGYVSGSAVIENVGLIDSYFSGSAEDMGGLVGHFAANAVRNCFNAATVLNTRRAAGGLVGYLSHGTLENCYNIGLTDSTGETVLVGRAYYPDIKNCYYLTCPVSGTTHGTPMSREDFASGLVSVLLGNAFGQTLGAEGDAYPVFRTDSNQVHVAGDCNTYTLSNTPGLLEHPVENGFCTNESCLFAPYQQPQQAEDGYWLIANGGNLYWFANFVNEGNDTANARLVDDITVNPAVLSLLDENGDLAEGVNLRSWTPMDSYYGHFDGQNHSISGLYCVTTDNYNSGLFMYIQELATVENLGIKDSYFKGKDDVGAVAGRNEGVVKNCYNEGTVVGYGTVGGVVGDNVGIVENCRNAGTVTGDNWVGGIAGWNYYQVKNCYNAGAVNGQNEVGGVVGCNYETVENCYNTGKIHGTEKVGGVVGVTEAYINKQCVVKNCYNEGRVSGDRYVGGVVGDSLVDLDAWEDSYSYSYVQNCHNTGIISGNYDVGGVVGRNHSIVDTCYNEGSVSGEWSVGGVVGGNYIVEVYGSWDAVHETLVTNCYNTGAVTGNGDVGGVVGCSSTASEANTKNQSATVRDCYNTGAVTGNERVGGVVGEQVHSAVENCYNTGAVTGTDNVGGVSGTLDYSSSVKNSHNDGAVTGDSYVGGVVGGGWYGPGVFTGQNETIENCYNTGTITGNEFVGGVYGGDYYSYTYDGRLLIKNCYNTGDLSVANTAQYVGGIYGGVIVNNDTVWEPDIRIILENCYNIGVNEQAGYVGIFGSDTYVEPENCYYLGETELDEHLGTTVAPASAFVTGEVCLLLGEAFGQRIGVDMQPVLDGLSIVSYVTVEGEIVSYHNSLAGAAEAAKSLPGCTVVLLAPGEEEEELRIDGGEFTLHFGGEELQMPLTIAGGTITVTGEGRICSLRTENGAVVTLKSGYYENIVNAGTEKIAVNSAEVTLAGWLDRADTNCAAFHIVRATVGEKGLLLGSNVTLNDVLDRDSYTRTINGQITEDLNRVGVITPGADLSEAVITVKDTPYDNGNPVTPIVVITIGGKVLDQGTDFEVTCTNNEALGIDSALVTITALAPYTGTAERTFSIVNYTTDFEAMIDELEKRVDELEAQNDEALNKEIELLRTQLSQLQEACLTEEDLQSLETAIEALEAQISALEQRVKANEDAIKALQEAEKALAEALENKADADEVEKALAALNEAIEEAKSLATAENAALKAELEAADDILAQAIEQLASELEIAVQELWDAISAGSSDTTAQIEKLRAALNAAIAANGAADRENKEELTVLIRDAKVALQLAIDKVAADLEEAKRALNEAILAGDGALDEKIIALQVALENAIAVSGADGTALRAELQEAVATLNAAIAANADADAQTNRELERLKTFVIVVCVIASLALAGCVALVSAIIIDKRKLVK